ncbi:MAG: efflux RND transporter periplasmic adaptor subunit [Candidatus Scalinduaceae bacterium]
MRFLKMSFVIGLILIASIAGTVLFFVNSKTTEVEKNSPKYKEFKIERGTFQVIITANGVVKPINRIEIKSKASGRIEELPVEEGDLIQKGELIARLDQKDELAEVAQTQANSGIAKAELKQAQLTFDHQNQLFQDNLISEEERDLTELNLAIAKGKLVQATIALERAKERLSESIVRAPIDGTILQKYVEEGQIIASGVSNVSGGTLIIDIADMSSVYIEAGIDEIDIGKIQTGQKATVIAEAYPQLKFNGKIARIAPEAKIEQNVTLFDVIIEVGNTDGKLKSGMNTDIEIPTINQENVLLVPTIALQTLTEPKAQSNERAVLLKQGSEFVLHKVNIGLSNFKQTEILSGLSEGSILGVPMTSRLKEENDWRENRIRRSRSFGTIKRKTTP